MALVRIEQDARMDASSGLSTSVSPRLVARLGAGHFLAVIRAVAERLSPDLTTIITFLTILYGNLDHYQDDWKETHPFASLAMAVPDSLRKPVTITWVAAEAGLPFETVRRRIRRLEDRGICRQVKGGFIVARTEMESAVWRGILLRIHAANLDLVDTAVGLGVMPREPLPSAEDQTREGARRSGRYLLSTFKILRGLTEDPMQGLIMRAVSYANTAHLTSLREAGRMYVQPQDAPPDSHRIPVTVYALARTLLTPYETTRRYVNGLIEMGWLVRVGDGGVIAPAEVLLQPPFLETLGALTDLTQDLLADLWQLGLAHGRAAQAHPT